MKQLLKLLFLLLLPVASFAQDLRPSAYLGQVGKVTVRGGKILGTSGGVTTIAETTITPANSSTTSIYIDLSGTPVLSTSTSGFPASSYFPICVVIKDANGIITSFTDSRPDSFMAGGSSVSPNTPLTYATSGPGPVFNVANYGAFHDTRSNTLCSTVSGTPTITCTVIAGVGFTVGDIGKRINCSSNGLVPYFAGGVTITGFTSTSVVTASGNANTTNSGRCVWGHSDQAAIATAFAAALAQASGFGGQAVGNNLSPTASPILYFPAGGWMGCPTSTPILNFAANIKGFKVKGDGYDVTYLYNCDNATVNTNFGVWISNNQAYNLFIEDLTFDGGYLPVTNGGFGYGIYVAVPTYIRNVHFQAGGYNGGLFTQQGTYAENFTLDMQQGTAINCNTCFGEFRNSGSSNSGTNLIIQNVVGSNTGEGLRWYGGLIDETGSTIPTQIINSHDVWFVGTAGFGTNTKAAMSVDATSFIHITGGIWGVFGNDTNSGGVTIATNGAVQASDVRFISSGTGKCINNSGSFQDNGGNTCESMFPIVSGTSTGTAAVLTVTTLGANASANCTAGDSILVEGAGLNGYNGYFAGAITAAAASTISYTTIASNIGALSAGGSAYCRNLQSYTGTLPRALLNIPTTNTCYVTGTFGATVTGAPMCNARLPAATNIQRITAASTTVTACSVAPVVTISDGTASVTLTITTAKSQWDSSVDASTGVGTTIFKPNGTLQVTNTVGTCTTAPTNFSLSYNPAPILSN